MEIHQRVEPYFKSMQHENQEEPVYTKKWMKAPANKSISCKANLGMFDQRMLMIFTPDTDCLHEGISVPDSVVLSKSGVANKINVLVVDKTSHNIQLHKNIYLGNVEIIKSIILLQVKNVSATNSHESLETITNTKSAEAVTHMEEVPSQEKDKIKPQDTTLEDYNRYFID